MILRSIVSAVALMLALNAVGATRYVALDSPNPSPPYTNRATAAHVIQDAVDVAHDGDVVLVDPGTYELGGADTSRVGVNKPITLLSLRGPETTIIKGAGLRCAYVANDALLVGFTLTNGTGGSGGGVFSEPQGVLIDCVIVGNAAFEGGGSHGGTLYSCTLADNTATYGGGCYASSLLDCVVTSNQAHVGGGSYGCLLDRVTLSGNKAYQGGGGYAGALDQCVLTNNSAVYGGGIFAGTLLGCTLDSNSAATGGGSYESALSNCSLSRNSTVSFGGGSYGGTLHNSTLTGNRAEWAGAGAYQGTLHNCTLTDNQAGERGGGSSGATHFNSIVYFNHAPQGSNHDGGEFHYCCTTPLPAGGTRNLDSDPQMASYTRLSPASICIGKGSASHATGFDIDGESWANPPCIGADQVVPGATLRGPMAVSLATDYYRVAAGSLRGLTNGILGSVAFHCWDFGDGSRTTNQVFRPVVAHAWTTPGTYRVRLTVYNDDYPEGVSTMITLQVVEPVRYVDPRNLNGSSPYTSWATASRYLQVAIDESAVGGVVWVTNGIYAAKGTAGSRVVIRNGVRVQSVNGPAVTVIRGSVTPEGRKGIGALRCAYVSADAMLAGFTLTGGHADTGGGAWCEDRGALSNCVVTANSAEHAGGGVNGGELYNCEIRDNSAIYGGGACWSTLYNCTIAINSASYGGGTFEGSLFNCIVTHNTAPDGVNCFAGMFNYCCTTSVPWGGIGNIEVDPQFVNALAGDFRLRSGSPCIDSGTNLLGTIAADFNGLPRPLDGNEDGLAAFDMGAHEFNPYRLETGARMKPHGFEIWIRGEPGKRVLLERSADLRIWEPVWGFTLPPGGLQVYDPTAIATERMFYRAVRQP